MSSVAGLLNLAAMLFSMKTVLAPLLGSDADELTFRIPMTAIPVILLVTVLLALFVAAGMMILASFARTFKEGQSLVSPFYISVFMPVMFLQVPGLELTPALALVPVVNVALVFREAVAGVFRWPPDRTDRAGRGGERDAGALACRDDPAIRGFSDGQLRWQVLEIRQRDD